jgi:hypothetical protein
MQERRRALPAQLAHEPGDEKGGIAFAAMLGADADRADLDRFVEPRSSAFPELDSFNRGRIK